MPKAYLAHSVNWANPDRDLFNWKKHPKGCFFLAKADNIDTMHQGFFFGAFSNSLVQIEKSLVHLLFRTN